MMLTVEEQDAARLAIEELVTDLIGQHGPEAIYDLVAQLAQSAAWSFGTVEDLDAHEQACLRLVDKVHRQGELDEDDQ
jgi:hypothetical protein